MKSFTKFVEESQDEAIGWGKSKEIDKMTFPTKGVKDMGGPKKKKAKKEETEVEEETIDGVKVKKLKPSGVTKDVQTALKKSNKGGVVRQAHRQKVGVKEEDQEESIAPKQLSSPAPAGKRVQKTKAYKSGVRRSKASGEIYHKADTHHTGTQRHMDDDLPQEKGSGHSTYHKDTRGKKKVRGSKQAHESVETGIDEGSWKDTNDKDSNRDFVGGRKKGKVYTTRGKQSVPMTTTKAGGRVPSSWKKMSPAELAKRLKKDRNIKEDAPGSKVGVSTSINQTGTTDPYDIQNADVLKRVNAFVGSIADREYLIPENAIGQLQGFLERIGLCFETPELPEGNGTVTAKLLRYGGVFGKSTTTPFNEFDREDGIDKSITITVEALRNNSWKVYAKIV